MTEKCTRCGKKFVNNKKLKQHWKRQHEKYTGKNHPGPDDPYTQPYTAITFHTNTDLDPLLPADKHIDNDLQPTQLEINHHLEIPTFTTHKQAYHHAHPNNLTHATIQITENQLCHTPYTEATLNGHTPNYQTIKQRLDTLHNQLNITHLTLAPNEPSLHPHFYEIIQYANHLFETVTVQTHATTPTKFNNYPINVIIKTGSLDQRINNQLYTVQPDLVDQHLPEQYANKIKNGQFYTAYRKATQVQNATLHYPLIEPNDLVTTAIHADKIGCDTTFRQLRPGTRHEVGDIRMGTQQFTQQVNDLQQYNTQSSQTHKIDSPLAYLTNKDTFHAKWNTTYNNQTRACRHGQTSIHVTADGTIQPSIHTDVTLGNLDNHQQDLFNTMLKRFEHHATTHPTQKHYTVHLDNATFTYGGCIDFYINQDNTLQGMTPNIALDTPE